MGIKALIGFYVISIVAVVITCDDYVPDVYYTGQTNSKYNQEVPRSPKPVAAAQTQFANQPNINSPAIPNQSEGEINRNQAICTRFDGTTLRYIVCPTNDIRYVLTQPQTQTQTQAFVPNSRTQLNTQPEYNIPQTVSFDNRYQPQIPDRVRETPKPTKRRRPQTQDEYELEQRRPADVNEVTNFGWNLFKLSNPQSQQKNFIISPISPQILLSNLISVADGQSRQQLAQTVLFDSPERLNRIVQDITSRPTSNRISLATAYFIANDFKLKNNFQETSQRNGVEIIPLNTKTPVIAAKLANDWVKSKTDGRINEILSPQDANAALRLLLVNAIHFQGSWKYKFINTSVSAFEYAPQLKKQMTNMYQLNKLRAGDINYNVQLSGSEQNGRIGQWVELPYEGEDLSMVVMLPEKRHDLDRMINTMTAQHIAQIFKELDTEYISTKVHLNMPKFTIKSTRSLVEPLQRLGLRSIFEGEANPFPGLSGEPTRVSDVKQQAFLSVDEKGTIATAVASLQIITLSINPQYRDVRFDVDQPFVAMIVDKTNHIPLFIAKVSDV